jgi:serine/threonine-protein kinase
VLPPDEAALFADCVGGGAAKPALDLLRGLLAERPSDRPRHALAISRQLAALRSAA